MEVVDAGDLVGEVRYLIGAWVPCEDLLAFARLSEVLGHFKISGV